MTRAGSKSMPVQALLVGLQRALCLLVPVATDLGVHWREPDNYDDWDNAASGVFDGFVLEAIRSSVGWTGCAPLIGYDRRITNYRRFSYLAIESSGNQLPLIRLETTADLFDTCLVAELDTDSTVKAHLRVPFRECRFVAVGRLAAGGATITDTVAW